MSPPNPRPTVRRNFLCRTDLAGWTAWYSTVSGRQVADIFNEAIHAWWEKHRDDYQGGPYVAAELEDLSAADKRRRPTS